MVFKAGSAAKDPSRALPVHQRLAAAAAVAFRVEPAIHVVVDGPVAIVVEAVANFIHAGFLRNLSQAGFGKKQGAGENEKEKEGKFPHGEIIG